MPLLVWGPAALLIVVDHLRRGFGHFNLGAHLLDLRGLLFQACGDGLNFLLLLLTNHFLFCHRAPSEQERTANAITRYTLWLVCVTVFLAGRAKIRARRRN